MPTPGWQQPAVPIERKNIECVHVGLIIAAFTIAQHPVGHVWICTCGPEFVVVSDGLNGPKTLEKRVTR